MKIGHWPAVRATAIGLALTAYVAFSHYVSSLAPGGSRFAAVALVPCVAVALALAWRSRHRYLWFLPCGVLALLAWRHLDAIGDRAAWVYFVQHVSANAILAVVFGASLTASRTPLCTRIAAAAHDTMEPKLVLYTRQVTLAWTIFFAANVAVSVLLFTFAPILVWSTFANVLSLPLVAMMFAAEYLVRRRRLPDIKHVSIFGAMRGYLRLARPAPPPA